MVLEEQALGGQQLPEQLTAHMAQVAGADGIELLRLGVGISEVAQERCRRSRSHRGPHVVDVPDARSCTRLGSRPGCQPLPRRGGAGRPRRRGGRPLGGGGAHGPIGKGARYCRSAVQKWLEAGQQAVCHSGAAKAQAPTPSASAMVLQAPNSLAKGRPSSRMA